MTENTICSGDISIYPVYSWNTAEILELYRAGGWWDMGWDERLIPPILHGSFLFVVACDPQSRAIGMGRIIADGASDGYIQDVVVFPEYRNQGIGSRIVSALRKLGTLYGLSWIGLISAPGKEEFYKRAGFNPMEKYTPMLFEGQ